VFVVEKSLREIISGKKAEADLEDIKRKEEYAKLEKSKALFHVIKENIKIETSGEVNITNNTGFRGSEIYCYCDRSKAIYLVFEFSHYSRFFNKIPFDIVDKSYTNWSNHSSGHGEWSTAIGGGGYRTRFGIYNGEGCIIRYSYAHGQNLAHIEKKLPGDSFVREIVDHIRKYMK
jgi:hypothetical protein